MSTNPKIIAILHLSLIARLNLFQILLNIKFITSISFLTQNSVPAFKVSLEAVLNVDKVVNDSLLFAQNFLSFVYS